MIPNSPCYKCEKRCELCHSSCSEYKDYRVELDAYNKMVQKDKADRERLYFNRIKRKGK